MPQYEMDFVDLSMREKSDVDPSPPKIGAAERAAMAAAMASSEATEKVAGLIRDYLFARVDEILRQDPEAKAYLNMLRTIGVMKLTARHIAHEYMERKTGTPAGHPLPAGKRKRPEAGVPEGG